MPIKTRQPRAAGKSRTSPGQTVIPGMTAIEPNKKKREEPELGEQTTLFFWLRLYAGKHPALGWVHASLNGLPLTPAVVRKAQASGMVPGIWDVLVLASRHGRSGLLIEMKAGRNGLTPEQERFREYLRSENYATRVAYSWIDALYWITRYLSVRDPHIDQALHANRKRGVVYATPDPLAPPTQTAPEPAD